MPSLGAMAVGARIELHMRESAEYVRRSAAEDERSLIEGDGKGNLVHEVIMTNTAGIAQHVLHMAQVHR